MLPKPNSTRLLLFSHHQKEGVESNLGIGHLTDFEVELLDKAIPELKKNIKKGEDWIKANPAAQ